ncbi:MAG: response regulator [bacterium]|nr:response regulator [bacterium]
MGQQTASDNALTVLVVEDNVGLRRLIMKRLEREQYRVEVVEKGSEAISHLMSTSNTILLLDYKLPDMTGREVIQRLEEEGCTVPFIIITGHGDERTAVEMMKLGARDYLVKDHAFLDVLPQVMAHVSDQVLTEKKLLQVRKALEETEQRFKVLFNSSADAVFVQETQNGRPGRFIEVNDIACRELGYSREELLTMTMADVEILDEDEHGGLPVSENTVENLHILYETSFMTKEGKQISVENNSHRIDLDGKPVILCISRDITQRKQLELQLQQAQKMEAVGKLAGGVAHDFNNLLTAIMGYSDLMLVKMQSESPFRDGVNEIKKAALRASALTQQLLAFSRKQIMKPRVMDINNTVNGIEKMLKRLIGEDVQQVSQLDPQLKLVRADSGQVEQVLLNLAINAADAMPQGGTLTITTENKHIHKEDCQHLLYSKPGQYVCLSIVDSGQGIDKNIIPNIFEPFFTTKKTGTGLGLAVVYGIIKQHNGWINVYSEAGVGTTIKVYFPSLDIGEVEVVEQEGSLVDFSGKGEKILLVEDEGGVRKIAARVLRDYGYNVVEAPGVLEALELFEKEKAMFNLVLSDVILQDKTGLELVDHLQIQKPGIKVLLTSGYADQKAHWSEVIEKGLPFLQKPYTMVNLLKKVREVLR